MRSRGHSPSRCIGIVIFSFVTTRVFRAIAPKYGHVIFGEESFDVCHIKLEFIPKTVFYRFQNK